VLDAHDADNVIVDSNAVDDEVRAAPSRVIAGKLAEQWSTDPLRLLA
jgi:hypothetical protein